MNQEWSSFLMRIGGHADPEGDVHFKDPRAEIGAAKEGDVLTDLSQFGLIRVSGADAGDFLNGQLSNDLRLLDDGHSQLSAYCNPQGRALAVFRVFRRSGDYWLQLPRALVDSIVKRLRMFVLRAKVTLTDNQELVLLGLAGPHAVQILETASLPAPQAVDDATTQNDVTVLKIAGTEPRFEIIAPSATAKLLWQNWAARAAPVGPWVWRWHDIQAGLPSVWPQTSAAFVPQMLNLDVLGGINFKKGCYTGQEIIARMHYLGRLKQRMYRAHADAVSPPHPGDPIAAPNSEQAVGTIVDAVPTPDGGSDLLAVIRINSAAPGQLYLGNEDGVPVTLSPLPYPVTAIA